jgi:two-component system sensor histidine kinase KdpD
VVGYAAGVSGVLAVALLPWAFYPELRGVTASAVLLMVVLLVAITWGMGPALFSSVLGAAYLNFFYVPPRLHFNLRLATGDEFVAIVTFLVTAILVGQLSSRAQRRAREVQELYDQLRVAFDRASQVEAIRQSERLKSALLDTVTHDLRTPLTSIKAAATTLIDVRNSDPGPAFALARSLERPLLDIIVKQCDRLNHFVEGMIELARVEAGGEWLEQATEGPPMDEIISAALARAGDLLHGRNVRVECADNLNVAANPIAIAQVLFSLLENAGRYAPAGTTVQVIATQSTPNDIQIAVEDEGPGVPPELRDRVFEKFFRRDVTRGQESPSAGLGLGLAIARGIVEAHGGRIWVEGRRKGEPGARFVFAIAAKIKGEESQSGEPASQ